MFQRILIGLAIGFLGWLMVWKTRTFEDMIGPIAWAEEHLGSSNFFYKLLGMAIIVMGIIVTLNLFDTIVGGFVRSVFP